MPSDTILNIDLELDNKLTSDAQYILENATTKRFGKDFVRLIDEKNKEALEIYAKIMDQQTLAEFLKSFKSWRDYVLDIKNVSRETPRRLENYFKSLMMNFN